MKQKILWQLVYLTPLLLFILPPTTSSPDILDNEPIFLLDEIMNDHITTVFLLHTPILTNDTVILNTLSLFVEEIRIIDDIPFVKINSYNFGWNWILCGIKGI